MSQKFIAVICILCLLGAEEVQPVLGQQLQNPYKPRVPIFDPTKHSEHSGKLPGAFSVSELGGATYQIPIALPPGQPDATPALTLAYDSSGQNTLLGVGWSLAGLSSINRCPQTRAQHGHSTSIDLSDNDQFCLDNQLLVLVSGVHGQVGALYRTENDTFALVEIVTGPASGLTAFRVRARNGLSLEYGATNDSRVILADDRPPLAWLINKATDRSSNYWSVTYQPDSTSKAVYPNEIAYSGNTANGLQPYNSVKFAYEDRSDVSPRYIAGIRTFLPKRLTTVTTLAGGNMVGAYRFSYEKSASTERSQLSKITRCGPTQCLPPTRVEWLSSGLSWNAVANPFVSDTAGLSSESFLLPIPGDFSGDGKTDVLAFAPKSGAAYYLQSTQTSQFRVTKFADRTFFGLVLNEKTRWLPLDLNADGQLEVLAWTPGGHGLRIGKFGPDGAVSLVFQSDGAFDGTNLGSDDLQIAIGDFDGDGRSDILTLDPDSGSLSVHRSLGNGTFTTSFTAKNKFGEVPLKHAQMALTMIPQLDSQVMPVPLDFNGDGRSDCIIYHPGGGEYTLSSGQEDGSLALVVTGKAGLPGFPLSSKDDVLMASDLNGDGLSDLIGIRQHGGSIVALLSDGTGGFRQEFQSPAGFGTVDLGSTSDRILPVDIDGDGAADLFAYKAGTGHASILKLDAGPPHLTLASTAGISGLSDLNNPSDLVVAGDWNGDGTMDLLDVRGGEMHFALGTAATDVVARIIDGQGQRIEITYGSLSSTDVYKRGTGAAYPQMDISPPRLVVSEWTRKDEVTVIDHYRLKYEGLRLSLDGRGLSGFRQVEVQDLNSGIKVRTTFNQEFPFKTLPERVETWDAAGKRISITANTWAATRSKGIPQAAIPLKPCPASQSQAGAAAQPQAGAPSQPHPATPSQPQPAPICQPQASATSQPQAGAAVQPQAGAATQPQAGAAAALNLNLSFMSIVSSVIELSALKQPDLRGITYFVYNRISEQRFYDENEALMGSRKAESRYDEFGNRIEFTQEDSSGATTTTETHYANDTARWIVGLPTQIKTVGNKAGQTSSTRTVGFDYDPSTSLLMSVATEPGTPDEVHRQFDRDTFGNIVKVTVTAAGVDPRSTQTEYDAHGIFPVKTLNPNLDAEVWEFDPKLGRAIRRVDANNREYTWEFDEFGRELKSSVQGGASVFTRRGKCLAGECPTGAASLTSTVTEGASEEVRYYSASGLVIKRATWAAQNKTIIVDYKYDDKGRLVEETVPHFSDEAFFSYSYAYDTRARIASVKKPDGGILRTVMSGLSGQTTNDLGDRQTIVQDIDGNIVRIVDPGAQATRYEYDAFNNLTKVIDPDGLTTEVTYDAQGRRTKILSPETGSVRFRYNPLGELIEKTVGEKDFSYKYDLLGRVVERVEPDIKTTWTYDQGLGAKGRLSAIKMGERFSEEYRYDNYGRVTSRISKIDAKTVGSKPYTLSLEYDAFGRVITTTYPDGFAVKNSYDDAGVLTELRDGGNGALFWRAVARDAKWRVTEELYGNEWRARSSDDEANGTSTKAIVNPKGDAVAAWKSYLDSAGRVRKRERELQDKKEVTEFSYDRLGRLIKEETPGQAPTLYEYTASGRLKSRSDIGKLEYDATRPALASALVSKDGSRRTYSFDAAGRRTKGVETINYSPSGLPIRIAAGQFTTELMYDPDGRVVQEVVRQSGIQAPRVRRQVGGVFEEETFGPKDRHVHVVLGPTGDAVAAVVIETSAIEKGEKRTDYYFHRERRGDVALVTGKDGKVVSERDRGTWWNNRSVSGDATPLRLAGLGAGSEIAGSKLVRFGHRLLDTQLGVFIQPEQFVEGLDNPQLLNRYGYALNNPLSYVDPSGKFLDGLFQAVGDFFRGVGNFIADNWKLIVAVAVAAAVTIATGGAGAGLAGAVLTGMMGGAIAGGVYAALSGGSFSQILTAAATGAVIGAFVGAGAYGLQTAIPSWSALSQAGASTTTKVLVEAGRVLGGGVLGGLTSELFGGGSFEQGFKTALILAAAWSTYTAIAGQQPTLKGAEDPYAIEEEAKDEAGNGLGNGAGRTIGCTKCNYIGNANQLDANGKPVQGDFWEFREGGQASRLLNNVPGINSDAVFHDSLIQMLPPGPSIAGMSTVWTVSEVVIVVNYAAIAWQYAPYYMAVRQDVKY